MDKKHVPEKYKRQFLSREHNARASILDQHSFEFAHRVRRVPLSSFPPTYLQVCERGPLRDDGLIYEEIFKEAGAVTKIDFFEGCPHVHWVFMSGPEVSTKAVGNTAVGFRWLLVKRVTAKEGMGCMVPKSA
ncbi:hypothetical protein LTR42_006654 [Elasticomyces elasticus]|nr:hypothetical protein LTR42_006654 [Elasticomyces elasticus]